MTDLDQAQWDYLDRLVVAAERIAESLETLASTVKDTRGFPEIEVNVGEVGGQ